MPTLAPGALLGGRYRLDHRLDDDGLTEVWAATDRVLARGVLVEALSPGAGDRAHQAFAAAAANAARLVHPNIVATYDGGVTTPAEGGTPGGLPFIVTERPSGPTLTELLERHGALAPGRVVLLGRQLARAIEAAHRMGVTHGGIGSDTVLIAEDDRMKLARFAAFGTRGLLAGPTPVDEAAAADVRAGAVTLVAALVGGARRLPPGEVVSARTIRPGIPRSLDDVLVATQRTGPAGAGEPPSITSAGELGSALDGLDIDDDAHPMVERDPTPPMGTRAGSSPARFPRVRSTGARTNAGAGVVVGLLLALAVGVAAFVLLSGTRSPRGTGGPGATNAPGGAGRGGALTITGGASFNPLGTGPENPDQIAHLYDGDPSTIWSTQTYVSRNFGNLKAGDGVYVTLARAHTLHQLTVISPSRGWTFQIYAASRPGQTLASWGRPLGPAVTVNSDVTQVQLGGVKAAAVLVWMTRLNDSPPYRVDIGELALR